MCNYPILMCKIALSVACMFTAVLAAVLFQEMYDIK